MRASFAVPFVVCGTTIAVLEFVLAEAHAHARAHAHADARTLSLARANTRTKQARTRTMAVLEFVLAAVRVSEAAEAGSDGAGRRLPEGPQEGPAPCNTSRRRHRPSRRGDGGDVSDQTGWGGGGHMGSRPAGPANLDVRVCGSERMSDCEV